MYLNYGVKCLDEQTLEIEFANPLGFWQYMPAPGDFPDRQARLWTPIPTPSGPNPRAHIANGPFKITEIIEGQKIVFEANENYWAGRPKLDRIEMTWNPDTQVLFEAYKKAKLTS